MRAAVRRAIFPRQFSPLDLGPGVVLAWWSADRDDTFTRTGGSPIVSWRDCVGGLTLTQSVSGSRPTWSANSFGGAPCVVFDGTDDELTLEAQPFPSAAGPVEMWAVASQAALAGDSSTRQLFGYGGTSNATRRALVRRVSGGVNRYGADIGDNSVAIAVNDASVDFSGRHALRCAVGATATVVSINTSTPVSGNVVPVTGTTRVRMGASTANTAANFWSGSVRDVVVTAALNAQQVAVMAEWAAERRMA
jgi:hypothetical protein